MSSIRCPVSRRTEDRRRDSNRAVRRIGVGMRRCRRRRISFGPSSFSFDITSHYIIEKVGKWGRGVTHLFLLLLFQRWDFQRQFVDAFCIWPRSIKFRSLIPFFLLFIVSAEHFINLSNNLK